MSYQPLRNGLQVREGVVIGVGTYLVGLLMTVVVAVTGLHPQRGIWLQTDSFGIPNFLALHAVIHIPGYGGFLGGELLVYTVLTIFLLVGAGYLVSRRALEAGETGGLKAGASIVFGYLLAVACSSVGIAGGIESVALGDLVAPTLIAGGLYPLLFGGIGGLIAEIE